MTPQLSIRVLPSEVPLDGPLFGISRLLPGINFGLQKFSTGNASIQALAGEDANFDLGHIQPARMLGCVIELHAAQEFLGSARSQHIVEALSEVGIQIVQHQVNSTRLGIDASEKPVDEGYEVNLSPMGGDRDDALATLSFRAPSEFAEQTKALASVFNMTSSDYVREAVREKNERVLKERMVFLSKTLSAQHLAENQAMDAATGDGLA